MTTEQYAEFLKIADGCYLPPDFSAEKATRTSPECAFNRRADHGERAR